MLRTTSNPDFGALHSHASQLLTENTSRWASVCKRLLGPGRFTTLSSEEHTACVERWVTQTCEAAFRPDAYKAALAASAYHKTLVEEHHRRLVIQNMVQVADEVPAPELLWHPDPDDLDVQLYGFHLLADCLTYLTRLDVSQFRQATCRWDQETARVVPGLDPVAHDAIAFAQRRLSEPSLLLPDAIRRSLMAADGIASRYFNVLNAAVGANHLLDEAFAEARVRQRAMGIICAAAGRDPKACAFAAGWNFVEMLGEQLNESAWKALREQVTAIAGFVELGPDSQAE